MLCMPCYTHAMHMLCTCHAHAVTLCSVAFCYYYRYCCYYLVQRGVLRLQRQRALVR